MASRLTDLVPRPSMPAKVGKPVRVRANFFQVNRLPQGNLFHYDVQITPEAKSGLTQKIWKYFEENMAQQAFGGIRVIFDGRQNAFSPKKLPIKDVFQTYEVIVIIIIIIIIIFDKLMFY